MKANLTLEKLHHYHYDFIKFKLYDVNVDTLNWNNLIPHIHLNNHFNLNSNGKFHDKNFDLYLDSANNITINTSLPYLVNGHNYSNFDHNDLQCTLQDLSKIIGCDLTQATILEMEFGAYQKINSDCKLFINSIIGLNNYQLEKATTNFKMYGNHKESHFKIYNPIANSKRKKTFTISKYPKCDLVKYEIKLTSNKKLKIKNISELCSSKVFNDFISSLTDKVNHIAMQQQLKILPQQSSLTHILFTALKNIEQQSGIAILPLTIRILEQLDLSASQKSKRKKALRDLDTAYSAQVSKR